MKYFKATLAYILVAALMLSTLCYAAAVEETAQTYAANLSVKTIRATCLSGAPDSGSVTEYDIPADTVLTARALHQNSSGEFWYEVEQDGQTLYVPAADTAMTQQLTDDVTAADLMTPAALGVGEDFSIGGSVTAGRNRLDTVTASVHKLGYVNSTAIIAASGDSGNLTELNDALSFDALAAGAYTFSLTAEVTSYYIDSSGAPATTSQTVTLERKPLVVTDRASADNAVAMGVDVSSWNGTIDWATAGSQIDFAVIRISSGLTADSKFSANAAGCVANGIPFGVCHVSSATTQAEAIAEAELVIASLEGYDPQFPVFFDVEYSLHKALTSEQLRTVTRTFCQSIKAAGYQPGLYTYTELFETHYSDPYFNTIPKWVSEIDTRSCSYAGGVTMWQYTWAGKISGIPDDVDCNYYYGLLPGAPESCDHSYDTVVTDPTCTEAGYTTHICPICADRYTSDEVAALGHRYKNGACAGCGCKLTTPAVTLTGAGLAFKDEILYNVYFTVSNPDAIEIVEMGLLTWTSEVDGDIYNADYVLPGAILEGRNYKARTQPIPAKNMGESTYLKVYLKLIDGSYVYSPLGSYSAKQYADAMLTSKTADESIKSLCVALMNYGAAAQLQFDYKVDELMNADLTAEQLALVDAYSADLLADVVLPGDKAGSLVSNDAITSSGVSVNFGGAFGINYNFVTSAAPEGDVKLYVWDKATFESIDTMTLENASDVLIATAAGNNAYTARVTGISAKNVEDTVYVCAVYEANGTTYCTGVLPYSVGAYCENYATGSDTISDLAQATCVYAYYARIHLLGN